MRDLIRDKKTERSFYCLLYIINNRLFNYNMAYKCKTCDSTSDEAKECCGVPMEEEETDSESSAVEED